MEETLISPIPAQALWFMDEGPFFEVALSSRVRLARNVAGYPFPRSQTGEQADEVSALICRAREREGLHWGGGIFSRENFPALSRRLLLERHLVSEDFLRRRGSEFYYRDDQEMTLQINYRNHLHITAMRSGLDLRSAWADVSRVDDLLESQLSYSHSLELGYLTEDIADAGTGLRASVMVHLPSMSRSDFLNRALESVTQLGFSVRGYSGKEGTLGEIFIIANEVAMGVSEEEILGNLEGVVQHLGEYEKKIREDMLVGERSVWEERIFRSWALLNEAHTLSLSEGLEYLSALRLGILLGWFDYLPLKTITMLFTFIQKGHILSMKGKEEKEEEARARVVQGILNSSSGEAYHDV